MSISWLVGEETFWSETLRAHRQELLELVGGAALATTIGLAVLALVLAAARRSEKKGPRSDKDLDSIDRAGGFPGRGHYAFLTALFVAIAVYGSLVPLNYAPRDFRQAVAAFRQIPFLEEGIESRSDWVANILLMIPIAFCAHGAAALGAARWRRAATTLATVVCCAALAVAIEFTQLWFPPRTVSQNDILAECLGAIVGSLTWHVAGETFTRWLGRFRLSTRAGSTLDWLLQAYLVGLCLYALMPLDLTLSPRELLQKYRHGRIAFVPLAGFHPSFVACFELAVDAVLFIPAGMLTASPSFHLSAGRRAAAWGTLYGLLLALILELAQVFVYSRYAEVTDLLTAALGVYLGARWRAELYPRVERFLVRHSFWARWLAPAACLVYAAALVAIFWSPFRFHHDREQLAASAAGFFRVPFSALYAGTEFNAMNQLLRKVLWFAPLGGMIALTVELCGSPGGARHVGYGVLLAAAFLFALAVEVGQFWTVDHVADLGDVLFYSAGITLGALLARRLIRERRTSHDAEVRSRS